MIYTISGINGFIGSHLRERLEREGHTFIPIHRDLLLEPVNLTDYLIDKMPDYIIHLAAYGNHSYQIDERKIFLANVLGTYNMLEATKNLNYKAFLNFSTTSHNLESGTFYGSTKSSGEYMARSFVQVEHKPIINIRPYSVFGEREWDFRFIPTIYERIRQGKEITVSNVEHDWIYIEDFLDGIQNVIHNSDSLIGKSVGIGSGKRINNIEVAETLMKVAGKKVTVIEGVKREYEVANHEVMTQGEKRNDEVFYTRYAKTPLEEALKNIYNNPQFLTRNWIN